MRKCSMTYKQAKKTVGEARENLDMSTQSLLWSRELEVECFRIVEAAKEPPKVVPSFEDVKPTITRRTIGGDDETNLSLSDSEQPQTPPPPRRELVREPLSASSFRHKKRGKSAGRAAGRRLLLSPQKRRSSVTIEGKSADTLDTITGESAQAPLQSTESTTSLSSALLREKNSRRGSYASDNSSLLAGGSQESVCSADSTSGSRFRRTKREADGRRPSVSRLKLRQNSSEYKENSNQDDIPSNSIDSSTHTASESVATTAKKEKKKKKLKAIGPFASNDTLEPAPASKKTSTKKKKSKPLDESNHTFKSADSEESFSPRASRKLQKHLVASSPSTRSDDAKKKKKKKNRALDESDHTFKSAESEECLTPRTSRKLQQHLVASTTSMRADDVKKKKKKDRALDESNHTFKSADSEECLSPRATPRKLKKHLVSSSPSRRSDDAKKKKKKDRASEDSNHTTKSADSDEYLSPRARNKLKTHLYATSPSKSLGDEKKLSRRSSKKKSIAEANSAKTKPMLSASSSLMDNGNLAIPQEVLDAFADCDSSARKNSRLHVRLKKTPKKLQEETVSKPEKFKQDSADRRQQDSSLSLLSTASTSSTKTRMLPVLRTSPRSPTKETREKFHRPVKSCGTGSKLKYQRRSSDSGLHKDRFPSTPSKIQERYASFVANNCDSPESFLSTDDSFSASQCSDFFASPESNGSSAKTLPCFPSLSPNMFDTSMSSLTAPRQPMRRTSGMGDFL